MTIILFFIAYIKAVRQLGIATLLLILVSHHSPPRSWNGDTEIQAEGMHQSIKSYIGGLPNLEHLVVSNHQEHTL